MSIFKKNAKLNFLKPPSIIFLGMGFLCEICEISVRAVREKIYNGPEKTREHISMSAVYVLHILTELVVVAAMPLFGHIPSHTTLFIATSW